MDSALLLRSPQNDTPHERFVILWRSIAASAESIFL
jgi:hypothetical protein